MRSAAEEARELLEKVEAHDPSPWESRDDGVYAADGTCAAARAVASKPTEARSPHAVREIIRNRLDDLDPAAVCKAGREP